MWYSFWHNDRLWLHVLPVKLEIKMMRQQAKKIKNEKRHTRNQPKGLFHKNSFNQSEFHVEEATMRETATDFYAQLWWAIDQVYELSWLINYSLE